MIRTLKTWCPIFSGFYNTAWEFPDGDIEWQLFDNPNGIDKDLLEFVKDKVYGCIDYRRYEQDIAGAVVDYINEYAKEHFAGIIKEIRFENVCNPKEYNFINDSIDIEIDCDVEKLIALLYKNEEGFTEFIKENYTSYDGFSSSYSNNHMEWLAKFEEDITHKLGMVLEYLFDIDELDMYEDTAGKVCSGEYIEYEDLLKTVNLEYEADLKGWYEVEKFIPSSLAELKFLARLYGVKAVSDISFGDNRESLIPAKNADRLN